MKRAPILPSPAIASTTSPLRRLLANSLLYVVPVSLLVVVSAAGVGELARQSIGYIGQCLLALIGLLLALLPFLPQHLPLERFGAANAVTLVRAGITALMVGWLGRGTLSTEVSWLIVVLATLAVLLDGVDGWLARRYGLASAFGARFDMEIDAFSILVMAALVYQSDKAGAWVILSGALRYGFVALGPIFPCLRRPLPPNKRRQTICVIQIIALIICLAPLVAPPWSVVLAGLALSLLSMSFAVDVAWLVGHSSVEKNGQ